MARHKRTRRRRRTVEQARREILGAAERRLIAGGPEAIRLQEIAADVGVSHSTILHHFGSRQGLMEALIAHAIRGLQENLLGVLRARGGAPARSLDERVERSRRMLDRSARLFTDRGYARLLAWLILGGTDLRRVARGLFAEFSKAAHASRVERKLAEGREPPEMEDTLFGISMAPIVLFGDALFGRLARLTVGLRGDPQTERRFRRWLAYLIEAYEPPAAARASEERAGLPAPSPAP